MAEDSGRLGTDTDRPLTSAEASVEEFVVYRLDGPTPSHYSPRRALGDWRTVDARLHAAPSPHAIVVCPSIPTRLGSARSNLLGRPPSQSPRS